MLKDGKTAIALRVRTASGQSTQIVIDEKSK
jgi:hypothetical protein